MKIQNSAVTMCLLAILINISIINFAVAAPNIAQGDAEFTHHNIAKAIQQYQIALKNNPDSIVARTRLAKCYMRKGYKSATSKMLDEALNLDANNIDALLLKGKLYIWEQQRDQAIKTLNQVLALSPDNTEAYTDLAGIYNDQGNTEAADALYLKINKLTENN